ncbi:MAG: prepilin-type N-terminal cleavage/methylation domain-containing protein [Proteobacteria bacterium]|nr:prepilin-type N-terminal cleavage/methylation domain-containing protein [Pseudomonadota bacterium]
MRNKHGYSLIELLIVIFTTSMLIYSGIELVNFKRQYEYKFFAKSLYLAIHQISINAISSNKDIAVSHEGDTIFYRTPDFEQIKLIDIPKDITIKFKFSAVQKEGAQAMFYASGVKSPGKIEITRGNDFCNIVIGLRNNAKLICD